MISSAFKHTRSVWSVVFLLLAGSALLAAADTTPDITSFRILAGKPVLDFSPVPSVRSYDIETTPDLSQPFSRGSGVLDTFRWTGSNPSSASSGFYRVRTTPLSAAEITAANLLNRIAYGPTPDDLEAVQRIGVDAWVQSQIAAESIAEDLDTLPPFNPGWRKVTASGTGSASTLYVYLDGPGDVYVDNLRLVAGAVDNPALPNLLRNGDFESTLGAEWGLATNVNTSARSVAFVQNGNTSLHLVVTDPGSTRTSSLYQDISPALSTTQTYTLTYWYRTSDTNVNLVVRLSGRGIDTTEPMDGLKTSPATVAATLNDNGTVTRLRSWHLMKAIASKRQLNEILRQFCENHFVTQYSKSDDYFANIGYSAGTSIQPATQIEFDENRRWQAALLNPSVTFLDLLTISAESPAMIIYLDTVGSRGNLLNGVYRIANENYARELCELFCFGVDNGYDQGDIVQISRVWTGWTTELRAPADQGNPFAPRSTVYKDPSVITNKTVVTNLVGNWTLRYSPTRHDPRPKHVFYQKDAAGNPITTQPKTVPARFGPPWAGRPYNLSFAASSYGTNTFQEGYKLLQHMANQPFTQEFITVKLCRLFIHDEFHTGYDFTDKVSSPEESLVKAVMLAWENPPGGGPKGQIRPILQVLLNSDLFRSTLSSQQKVRTPIEFGVAAVRALRTARADGSFTADSDGLGIQTLLTRAGRMRLFDRAEPDGYPETASPWISAGTLAERLRFVQSLTLKTTGTDGRPAGELDNNTFADPVALLRERKPAALSDAGVAADYLLNRLFPAEGAANLAAYRTLAIQFLNTADNGVTPSAYSSLTVGSATHDNRIRGLVAFLMTTPRFQEQ